MNSSLRYLILWIAIIMMMLSFASYIIAQSFTKVTDPTNPIVSDAGPAGYSGAAWIDFDNDGDLDLFVNNDKLYRNDGAGTFVSLTTTLGTGQPISGQIIGNGNSWADYDNDGDLDVFISSANSYLYRNDGGGNFTQVTTGDIGDGFASRGWSCAWADFNNDGNIDLAITHPAGFVPPTNNPTMNHLFINDGPPNYTFTRDTTSIIVTSGFAPYTVVTWSDFDMDGDMDCFMGAGPANGSKAPDYLFRNLLKETGVDTFERISESPIATDQQDGQIWNWIDYDNDGDLDAYLTNWGGPLGGIANRLYRNDNGTFARVDTGAIVTDVGISLSSVWEDFDNDGDLDCYVANDGGQPDRYYQNDGDGSFTRITSIAIAEGLTRHGASAADYDNDGKIDLLAVGPGTAKALYHNDTQNSNTWLTVKCTGMSSNKAAIGTKVWAKANINGNPVWQLREISAQNTFNGHNSLWAHFGLGDAAVVDSLKFQWSSGIVQSMTNVSVNQILTVQEDTTQTSVETNPPHVISDLELYQNYPNPFNPETTIRYFLATRSKITLAIYNIVGQKIRTLVDDSQSAGSKSVIWNGRDDRGEQVSSGIYFYRLRSENKVFTKEMVLLR